MHEHWSLWLIGLGFGALIALAFLVFGVPFLALALAMLAVGVLGTRSFGLLSGALVGAGATYVGLLIRVDLECEAFDRGVNQSCQAPDSTPYLLQGIVVALAGLLVGAVAMWRAAVESR